ncbi:MAG: rRNA maturation RNase YbeY [Candidatus Levyibacteriota bacterium]
MDNFKILIFVESRYQVNRKRITTAVKTLLKEQGVVGPAEVSVAIVGNRKMRSLNKKYKGKDMATNVLSFSLNEGEAGVLPTDTLRLGDVVVSYPKVIQEAALEEVLVDEKIDELVQHGLLHLLGIHHEE